MRKSKIIALLVTLSIAPPAWADTADDYEGYIDQMIPLSYEFAKVNASLREHEVFINILSDAQHHLGNLSIVLERLFHEADSLKQVQPTCPERKRILDLLLLESSFKRDLAQAESELDEYHSLRSGLSQACNTGFEHLHFGQDDFDVLTPDIETMDGVYVSYGDPFQAIVDLVSSIFSFFSNQNEQGRIQNATEHFYQARAHDADLQTAAQASCNQEMNSISESFSLLTELADRAQKSLSALKALPWERQESFLSQCIRDDEQQTVMAWMNRAIREVEERQDPTILNAIHQLKLRPLIQHAIVASGAGPCDESLRQEIRSLIASAKMLSMTGEKVYSFLLQAQTRCEETAR